MNFTKKEWRYIYDQYEKFTQTLTTASDYEAELQRAKKTSCLIHKLIYDDKRHCYRKNFPHGVVLINFLISRINNCYIKINQLKNRGDDNV